MGRGGKKSADGWVTKVTLEGEEYYYREASNEITWEKPEALLTRDEIEANKGDWAWVPHPTLLWQPARTVNEDAAGTVHMVTEAGKNIKIPKSRVMNGPETNGREQKVPLWPLHRSVLKHLEDDLVAADGVNEGIISYTLRELYENKSQIYTWVGAAHSVLVAVNPYKDIKGLYTPNQVRDYERPPPNKKLPPHVFGIAANSYNALLRDAQNQSILISGESGAGKTVATKHCLSWLADVAGSESHVEGKILSANPVLEAFGNAKTIRNNNSSRFGKWIEVYFDGATGGICGASIQNYLLERSRVVYQQRGERNFHIFYQMTGDRDICSRFDLEDASAYQYLNKSGVIKANDVDDEGDLQEVLAAFEELEFGQEEQEWIMATTVAVLLLGNVEFSPKTQAGSVQGSAIKNSGPVKRAADLLGVDPEELDHVLTFRSISVRGEKSVIPLDPTTARDSCDSLAKGIYSRLFDYLVSRINESLEGRAGKFIGILDIFGFEIFENNSFEQLCINYCNEKLQQFFNRTTFKEEESLYAAEGITFKHIEFIDNQVVLDLIEQKPVGILLMLDEETLVPEGSNEKLMNKMESQHQRNPKFQVDPHRRLNKDLSFEVVHYAGVVKYDAELMMQKNIDTLYADMYACCQASSEPRLAGLFPNLGRQQIKSVSYKFRKQLNELMDVLYETESRYIRCVKPNNDQRPDRFETPLVVEQLRYSGVFEAVAIRKQGYPFRLSFRQFRCRYSCINQGHVYRGRDDRAVCEEIIASSPHTFEDVQFGRTLVLYKAPVHKLLTLLRNLALESIVPICQSVIRGGIAREFHRRLEEATHVLQEALDLRNDIDALDDAIKAVEPTIGPLARVFSAKPVNLPEAVAHREDLQKWKDLESIFERLTEVEKPSERQFKELSDAVARAAKLLDIPRTDRQIELFDLARQQVVYMSIKLQEKHLDDNLSKYELDQFGDLRDPMEYASKKMFGKAKAAETMLVWQKSGIVSSLTVMDDKLMIKKAKEIFGLILSFANDKKNKDPDGAGSMVVQIGIDMPEMRDEIYAQIIKQLQANPNPESEQRLYGLLGICLSRFVPSEDFELFVLAQTRKSENSQKFVSAFHTTKYGSDAPSAPSSMSSAINAFESNKNRSRYSVMPARA
ncbi:Myosin-1 [Hondaea fermentalgiana]|uniref:Myosin-1 n=1 Tax=Hondaea fermentalgiana TaxID=2315210 RepID=A0A2R5GVT3_9STRA|nr:Myosin-1 [Hondaea fermentalgiana]|eukprot:GBG32521.1 Myosin-1 [Hondaea fermentalgiana]